MSRSRKLSALLACLQVAEKAEQVITDEGMLSATGWRASTLRTYLGKGLLTPYLDEVAPRRYRVSGTARVTDSEFRRRTTQSQYLRDVHHACRSKLARSLVHRSQENMILALELYNRPSLQNRLEAFSLLFCTAWEQLLKAMLAEHDGDESIFKPVQPGRHRETIGLSDCLQRASLTSPVRRNLEKIKYLRDRATHLLLPELQPVCSRLFQAGVLNFSDKYADFSKTPFLPGSSFGMMTLVAEGTRPNVVKLRGVYGTHTAHEIMDLLAELETEISAAQDNQFAVPLDYRVVFTKKPQDADLLLCSDSNGTHRAIVIEKPRDIEHTHPYLPSDVLTEVQRQLAERFRPSDLAKILLGRREGLPAFNTYDLEAVLHREGWKNANTDLHHFIQRPPTHRYSPAAVDEIVARITRDHEYLQRARDSLSAARRQTSRGRSPPRGRSGT